MVNELLMHTRRKELILVGLWFGKNKPNMNVFLGPFGFTQFNELYGFNQCLHPGECVKNPNKANSRDSGNIKYPLQNKVPKNRNIQDTIEHMRLASDSRKPVFGVKNPPQLINLISFPFLSGYGSDSMHLVSGIAKPFATMLYGNIKKGGLFPKTMILKIDIALINIKATHQIVRLTRSFTEKEFWKAREWENWTLFFNMPILSNVLPSHFVIHWALFVKAMYLLMKEEISTFELDFVDQLLHEFVSKTKFIYSKAAMTYNVHSLLHLASSVYHWGPLWAHNEFSFEYGNGDC
ncbi:uncharacterized protein LOC117178736 [Belonocnema kinseyi]|uniref:uncharacterized protein LOC117178736 n=1 Tax=Belonocnema kinseyi TaxID=2817044 RepID=UPI00143DD7A6|nr:uncharacterized protein LOC117178736 [Belonocnema kinseyi]